MAQETANMLAEEYVEDSHVRIRNDHTKTAGLGNQELFYASLTIGVFACGHCRSQRAREFKLEWSNLTV